MAPAPNYRASFDFDTPEDHHRLLHSNPHGTVVVWESLAAEKWHKIEPDQAPDQIAAFLRALSGKQDTYFTVNEFYGWRLQRLLKSLRAVFVDADLGREATRHDLDEVLERLREKGMPAPSLVIFSGRGLHLYWITKHTPPQALPAWQAVEAALIDALKDFHADPKVRDCTRVLRIAGTLNSKSGAEVRGLVLDGRPWSFHQLTDEVLGHRPTKPRVRSLLAASAKRGDHPRSTPYRRWHLVLQDLHKIGNHHGQIPEGHRNEFLFLGSVALSWFAAPESIEDEVIDLAKLYCPEIHETEAIRAASQSIARAKKAAGGEAEFWLGQPMDPRYRFKRKTLWERLEGLASPIKHQLRAIIPDSVANERKKEVWSSRWDDHNTGIGYRVGNNEKVEQAKAMRVAGATQRQIGAELGVHLKTVQRWLG